MVNIDFHIHISKTSKDNNDDSDFNISNLEKLITENELCAIAITDHNYFDKQQFEDIKNKLNKNKIFPGMEISIDYKYHALLIFDDQYVDYEIKLNELNKIISDNRDNKDNHDFITSDKLIEYLKCIDKDKYILIPHWMKNGNNWDRSLLKKFIDSQMDIKCLECANIVKQKRLLKDMNGYTPVCFGDYKLFKSIKKEDVYGYRVTTLDINKDNITFSKIREALQQNNKIKIFGDANEFIYWYKNESNYYFNCGLNVILGKRGSGKTETLNRIYAALNPKDEEDPRITYIKQFEVSEKAKGQNFEIFLKDESRNIKSKLYGDNINEVIKYISNINLDKAKEDINKDVNIIFEIANKTQIQKYKILSSQKFTKTPNQLDEFIKNIVKIQKSELIKMIVDKYRNTLSNLLNEIETKWYDFELDIKLKKYVNDCLTNIKEQISIKGNLPQMPNLSEKVLNYVKHYEIIKNNNLLFKDLSTKTESINIGKKFQKRITISKFKNKEEIVSCIGKYKGVTKDTFDYYKNDDICKFIQVMINDKKIDVDLLRNALVNVDVEIKNEHGNKLSGGEKSYYILLSILEDVNKGGEILLLDEIDNSFDNIFLYDEIVSKIKEMISKNITICIATHNSTIALLTDPNKIIFCDYNAESNEYLTYNGNIDSKEFKNVDKSKPSIDSYETIIKILESGEIQYQNKKKKYEQFKQ